jgi:hypothetical protein
MLPSYQRFELELSLVLTVPRQRIEQGKAPPTTVDQIQPIPSTSPLLVVTRGVDARELLSDGTRREAKMINIPNQLYWATNFYASNTRRSRSEISYGRLGLTARRIEA